jgi:restriction system protein
LAIPDFQSLMLPLLTIANDGREHSFADAVDKLADQFALTPEERIELLPSGRYPRFRQRVGWAKTYLNKALLLSYPQQSTFRITERGAATIGEKPDRIDIRYLLRFPEFRAFREASRPAREPTVTDEAEVQEKTPRELLEASFVEIRRTLAEDVLQRVKANSPDFFQRLVIELLVKMGYGATLADAGRVVGGPGDRGIDGIVKQDVLGLEAVYVQAKRFNDAVVGGEIVRNFAGTLLQHKAQKGVLITTSRFSSEANLAAQAMDKRIVLIDGERLAELLIDHGVGVIDDQAFVVRRIDADYFEEF